MSTTKLITKEQLRDALWTPCEICSCFEDARFCICGVAEKVLRLYAGGAVVLTPMNKAQRAWCIDEVIQCHEGYSKEDLVDLPDKDLANSVLRAWQTYVNDMR